MLIVNQFINKMLMLIVNQFFNEILMSFVGSSNFLPGSIPAFV